MHELKIPKSRVGCLVGTKGEMKRIVERSTNTKLRIHSEGDVEISGDSYGEYVCEKIVRAVGRGFNPHVALNLISDNYSFEMLEIKDYSGTSKKKLMRLKSRLIGTKGKARRVIEGLTGCHISIYGKTVSIIGKLEELPVAFKAVKKILNGSNHGTVYAFINSEMKSIKRKNH